MIANSDNKNITLEFSEEEAFVLLEWLARFNSTERSDLFQDQAEQRVLWDLEAELERFVLGPFLDDYEELLAKAREQIRDK